MESNILDVYNTTVPTEERQKNKSHCTQVRGQNKDKPVGKPCNL